MPIKNNKPIHDMTIWPVRAAIWANETEEGDTFYNVTFQRSYKVGEEWKNSDSFALDDLLKLEKLASWCTAWIVRQEAKDREDRK